MIILCPLCGLKAAVCRPFHLCLRALSFVPAGPPLLLLFLCAVLTASLMICYPCYPVIQLVIWCHPNSILSDRDDSDEYPARGCVANAVPQPRTGGDNGVGMEARSTGGLMSHWTSLRASLVSRASSGWAAGSKLGASDAAPSSVVPRALRRFW